MSGFLEPVKRILRPTPLYPVLYPAYRWLAPRTRAFEERSRRVVTNGLRVLRGQPPLPPPLPPTPLIVLVAGNTDPEWFLQSGRMGAESIAEILEKNGLSVTAMGAVLDFGCGVGRVLRHWSGVKGPTFYGTDYNPELVEWCRENLSFARVQVNGLTGALSYPPNTFDLVYALSVFTHLTPDQQDDWMKELGRITKPGGHLLITTHGEYYLSLLPASDQEAFRAGRRVTIAAEHAGTNVCAAYHPHSSVRDHLAAGFDVVDFIAEGARGNPKQDYWLLRKPA